MASNPQKLFDIIQKIARHGLVDGRTGAVHGTERTVGYVAKIHEDGDLAGTIDVQEYIDYDHADDVDAKVGYHEGVLLNAMQGSDCYLILPKLYSDVVVVMDVATQKEYVTMFSHVDTFRIDAHERVSVGVSEREEYDPEDEDAPDVDGLEKTGSSSSTEYTKDSVVTSVTDGSDTVTHSITPTEMAVSVGDGTDMSLTGDTLALRQGDSLVKMAGGSTYVGSDGDTGSAVLGEELADLLADFINILSKMMTPTMMGPQPPTNAVPQLVQLMAKVKQYRASCSGFLSKHVKVQK